MSATRSRPLSTAPSRSIRRRNVLVLAGSLDENPDRERELAHTLINRRVDGVIIMPAARDHRWVVAEQQAGTSFVFIDRVPSPLLADAVVSDNRSGARKAVRHLLKTGRTQVAYLGDTLTIVTAHERFQGFEDAMVAARLRIDPALVRHDLRTVAHAAEVARELLTAKRLDAIFTSQNLVTIGFLEAVHTMGQQHNVAHVGFDDVPLASVLQPGVTVMAQDPAAIGRQAAQRLFERIDGDASPPAVYTIPSTLVTRGSGELPA